MKNKIDLLLVNSIAPRNRIASDASLENSLAILRTYLESKGFLIEVIDEQRVTSIEAGVPKWCLKLLQLLVWLQMKVYSKNFKHISAILMLFTWPIQALSLYCRTRYINSKINDIIHTIKKNNISLLGIKMWYGDAFKWSKMLAAKVSAACPEVIIIAGGPQVKVYGENVFHQTDFDIAIMGPGEELLEKIISLRHRVNSKMEFLETFRNEISQSPLLRTGNYKLCEQPKQFIIPRYRPEDLQDKILLHTLVDGFGCSWNKCNFCSHTRQTGTYRPRPVEDIIREIKLMQRQGISFFRFSSSETPVEHGKNIAQAILAQGLNINYSMFVRAGKVTPEIFDSYRLMIESGLRAVFMGGETGHDLINNKVMNKGVRKKDIIDTIHCIKLAATEAGKNCRIGLSMIYPCPVTDGVTLEEVYTENLSLIREAIPDTVLITPPGVFPETTWMDNASEFGFSITPDFVFEMMQYEYSAYKPIEFWNKLGISLQGRHGSELLKETGRIKRAIMALGIPTDISDEYLMMTEAIGCTSKTDLLKFKSDSLRDIMSGNTHYLKEIAEKINAQGRRMAYGDTSGNYTEETLFSPANPYTIMPESTIKI